MTTKKSAVLVEKENAERDRSSQLYTASCERFIQPSDKGVYRIQPVAVMGDFVAVAPIPRPTVSSGGIVLAPSIAEKNPETGIVVGIGPSVDASISIGTIVKFKAQQKVIDLDGDIDFYGQVRVAVYRAASLIVILGLVEVEMVE